MKRAQGARTYGVLAGSEDIPSPALQCVCRTGRERRGGATQAVGPPERNWGRPDACASACTGHVVDPGPVELSFGCRRPEAVH